MQEFFIFVVNSTEMAHVIFDNDVIDVYFPLILKQYSLYSLSLLKKPLLLQKKPNWAYSASNLVIPNI